MRAVLEAVNQEETKQGCATVHAIIGHSSSGPTETINKLISPLGIPQVNNAPISTE